MLVNASLQLVSTCVGWPNGVKICADLRTNVSSTSQRKSSQVGGQTKRKLNTSRKLALTCVDLRVRLDRAQQGRGGEGRGKGKSTEEIWNRKKGQKKRGQSRAVQNRISPSADILQLQPKQLLSAFRSVAHWQFLPCCTPVCDTRVPGPAAPLPSLGLKIEEKICVYVYVYVYV